MEKYIKTLLISDSRAIIPQFGAIQALREDQISLSFNPYLNFDDGKILALIEQEEGLSEEDARRRISREVDSYNNRISDGERVTLSGIGTFYKDNDGATVFEQDPNYNENDTPRDLGFSTPAFSVADDAPEEKVETPAEENSAAEEEKTETVAETEPEPSEEVQEQESSEETTESDSQADNYAYLQKEEEKKKSKKRLLIILLLLLLLLIGVGVYFFVIKGDSGEEIKTEQVEEPATPPVEEETDAKKTEAPVEEKTAPEAKPEPEKKENKLEPTVARPLEKRYNIIVGSYKDESAAIARVNDLQSKGFSEAFVGMRKNYFVAVIGSFSNITQAENMQEQIVDGKYHIESWITNSGENEK